MRHQRLLSPKEILDLLNKQFEDVRKQYFREMEGQNQRHRNIKELSVCSESCSALSDMCNPKDYIVHGILQARILEWVAVSFSRGSPQPRDGTRVRTLDREDLLEKEMATHSSILACRIPWTEEPAGLQSMRLQRVGHN